MLDNKRGMVGLCYVLDSHLQWPRTDQVGFKNVIVIREAMGGKYHRTLPGFDDHAAWGGCQVGASATFVDGRDMVDEN